MKLISKETKTVKSAFSDEFENYLKKQQVKTTFNGYEIQSFSWYRKALGLAQEFYRDLGSMKNFNLKGQNCWLCVVLSFSNGLFSYQLHSLES